MNENFKLASLSNYDNQNFDSKQRWGTKFSVFFSNII